MAHCLQQQGVFYSNAVAFPPPNVTLSVPNRGIVPSNDNFITHPTMKYNARVARIVGVVQITTGVLIIVCSSLVFGISPSFVWTFTSSGIPCGVVTFIAGVFGVLSGRSPQSLCLIIYTMTMSITSAALHAPAFIVYINSALQTNHFAGIALNSMLALLVAVGGVAAIISTFLCSRALCHQCTKSYLPANPDHVHGSQQAVYIPNHPGYTAMVPPRTEQPINPPLYPPFHQYPIVPTAPIFEGYNDVPASPPPPYKE